MSDEERVVETYKEIRQEFRTVCKQFGTPGHHEHQYTKETLELTERYMKKMNNSMHPVETPFRIQTRRISDWESIEDNDD